MWTVLLSLLSVVLVFVWLVLLRLDKTKPSGHGPWRILSTPSPSVPGYVLSASRQSGGTPAPVTPVAIEFGKLFQSSSKNSGNPAFVESSSSQLLPSRQQPSSQRPPLSSPSYGAGKRFAEFQKQSQTSRSSHTSPVVPSAAASIVATPATVRKNLFSARRFSPAATVVIKATPLGAPDHTSTTDTVTDAILTTFDELQAGVEETRSKESMHLAAFLVRSCSLSCTHIFGLRYFSFEHCICGMHGSHSPSVTLSRCKNVRLRARKGLACGCCILFRARFRSMHLAESN